MIEHLTFENMPPSTQGTISIILPLCCVERKLHATCLLTLKSSLPPSARKLAIWSLPLLHLTMHLFVKKKPTKSCKAFPIQEQIEFAIYDNCVMPEKVFTLRSSIQWKKRLHINGLFLCFILSSVSILLYLLKMFLFQRFCR